MISQLLRSEIGEVLLRRAWYDSKHVPEHIMNKYKQIMTIKNWHESLFEMMVWLFVCVYVCMYVCVLCFIVIYNLT